MKLVGTIAICDGAGLMKKRKQMSKEEVDKVFTRVLDECSPIARDAGIIHFRDLKRTLNDQSELMKNFKNCLKALHYDVSVIF